MNLLRVPKFFSRAALLTGFISGIAMASETTTELTSEPTTGRPVTSSVQEEESSHEIVRPMSLDIMNNTERISQIGFIEPALTPALMQEINQLYSYVDVNSQVPRDLMAKALSYYHTNLAKIENPNYLSIADFSQNSSQPRFYLVNMNTGAVWNLHVAHGKNSDPGNTGFATRFSNANGSEESSLGFFLTAETYYGEHGLSLRIDGLSSTNSNVRQRAIVIHGASYVYDENIKAGRSWGCFAFPMDDRDKVVQQLKGGSLVFAAQSSL